jgi:hypothetical protein
VAGAGRRARLEAVRVALSTAAPLRGGAWPERFEAAFGVPLDRAYGIIEAACRASTCTTTFASLVRQARAGLRVALADEHGIWSDPDAGPGADP